MHIDHNLHAAITDLPEGLEIVYGEGEKPEWMTTDEAIAAAITYCIETGAKPGKIWGASVRLQTGSEPKFFVDQFDGLFPFAKLETREGFEGRGWTFPRLNCPSVTKVHISNPRDLRGVDNIIDRSEGAEDCVLMGLYEGNGVNPSQLIVCLGGVWNDEIIASGNPAELNFRLRQKNNFGLDIDEGTYRPTALIVDGSMHHLMWEADYGTKRAEWLIENFSSDVFSRVVVIRDHPDAIAKAGAEFEEEGYQLWKWAVPLSQRAHGFVA